MNSILALSSVAFIGPPRLTPGTCNPKPSGCVDAAEYSSVSLPKSARDTCKIGNQHGNKCDDGKLGCLYRRSNSLPCIPSLTMVGINFKRSPQKMYRSLPNGKIKLEDTVSLSSARMGWYRPWVQVSSLGILSIARLNEMAVPFGFDTRKTH